jgi:hypothetical protein
LRRTWKRRPTLLDGRALTKEEQELLAKVRRRSRPRLKHRTKLAHVRDFSDL